MKNLSQSFKKLFFSTKCSVCGKTAEDGYICRECFKLLQKKIKLRNIDDYYFLYYYDEEIKKIISDYKLKNRRGLAKELSYLAKNSLKRLIEEKAVDIIIPMPISKKRMRERGFNQVEELLDVMKIEYQQVDRIKDTKHMYSILDEQSREKNIKGVFINKNIDVDGKNLLIVDDIVTTGSSTRELIKEIRKKGEPKEIYVFSIALSKYFK